MAPTDQEISDNVSKLSKSGAPDEVIAEYVDIARSEQTADVGRKRFSPEQLTSFITGSSNISNEKQQSGNVSTTTGLTEDQYGRRQQTAEASLQALERDFGDAAGTFVEIGLPIAVTVATGGMGLPAAIALRAASGALGTAGRRFLQGEEVFSSKGIGQMVESSVLAGAPIPAFGRGIKEVGKAGLTLGGISTGASVSGQLTERSLRTEKEQKSIDDRLASIESSEGAVIASNALKSGFTGFGFGVGLHALSSAFGKLASNRSEIDASRRYFEEAGVNPTFGMLIPERAGLEKEVAKSRPELAARIDSAPSSVFKSFWTRLGDVPDNASMRDRFAKIVPLVDDAENLVMEARSRTKQSLDSLNQLKGSDVIDPIVLQKAEADHAAKMLEELSIGASADGKIAKLMGDSVGPTEHANIVTNLLNSLNKNVSEITGILYKKTGLSTDTAVIPRDRIVSVAEKQLGKIGAIDTDYGKSIMDAVRGESAELTPAQKQISAMFGDVQDSVSWSQYQELRHKMSSRFGNINPGQLDAAEAAASKVYRAIGDELMSHFEKTPSLKSAAAPLRTAMDFYRDISHIRDSNIGRELFNIPIFVDPSSPQFRISGVKASSLDSIAESLRKGDTDTLNNLYAMVSRVSKYSPEVGQSLVGAVHASMRDNFLRKNIGNPVGVIDDLLHTAKTADMIPFVESLGFGNIGRIKQMKEGFKPYTSSEITSDVIDSVLTNPDVPNAIPRAIFDSRVKQAALLDAINDKAGARKKLSEAISVADKAKLDEADAVKLFDKYSSDDLIGAFSGLGKYTITAEAGITGRGTISYLLQQMPQEVASKAMKHLRKNDSNLADMVSRKIWSDELQSAVRTERYTPGESSSFDLATFGRIFNPKSPSDVQRFKWLSSVAGSAMTDDMKKFLGSVAKVEDSLRKGGYVGEANVEKLSTAANIIGASGIPLGNLGPLGLTALTRRVARAARGGYYDFLVYVATDNNFARKIAASNDIVNALKQEPMQRAYLYYSNGTLMKDLAKLSQEESRGSR
jgi:hypothetical protein